MPNQAYQTLINLLNNNYSSLLDKIGDARFVLMGEATHGSHEFYQARIEISKALIERKGFTAMEAVISYLSTVDAEAAKQARLRYACFDHIKADPQTYGYLTSLGVKKSCIKESMEQFLEIQHHAMDYVRCDGKKEYFCATQNARIVKNAEHYYRAMFEDHVSSWNIRDQHMAESINILADHLECKKINPGLVGSYEALFHQLSYKNFLFDETTAVQPLDMSVT